MLSFGFRYDSPHHFVTSQWKCKQVYYIVWRGFWCLWHIAWHLRVLTFDFRKGEYPTEGFKFFTKLTNWSYTILLVQSSLHFAVVVHYTRKGANKSEHFQDETKWHLKILWLLTSIGFDAAIAVSSLYWTLVFQELKYAMDIMIHGVNAVYVLMDIFVVASPVHFLHFVYSSIYGGIYVLFTLFYFIGGGTNFGGKHYLYKSLDWAKPGSTSVLVVCVVFIALPLIHTLQFSMYTLRLIIWASWCGPIAQAEEKEVEFGDVTAGEIDGQEDKQTYSGAPTVHDNSIISKIGRGYESHTSMV